MRKILTIGLVALSFSTTGFAQEAAETTESVDQPHHIISIGTEGFGWSGLSRTYDWNQSKSGIKDHEESEGNINLNYSYVFPSRLMLGVEVTSKTQESTIKETNGDKTKSKSSETEAGISLGYNFNDDVYNSWWLKAVVATGKYKEDTDTPTSSSELDYSYTAFYIRGGKRISLDSWGLKNVSYNPSISLASYSVSGDAKKLGLKGVSQLQLDLIRIDILF